MQNYEVTALLVGAVVACAGLAAGRIRGNVPEPLQVAGLFVAGAGLAGPAMIAWTAFQPDILVIQLTLPIRIALVTGSGAMFYFAGRGFLRLCREILRGPEPKDPDERR